ncbi:MAG: hypothetical protein JXR63_06090 [Spirochaetales bacterium]|nr:hypothetical protein [Spirochaetales bacterium]
MLFLLKILLFMLVSSNVFCVEFEFEASSREAELGHVFEKASDSEDSSVWESKVSQGVEGLLQRWESELLSMGCSATEIQEILLSFQNDYLQQRLSAEFNTWLCSLIESSYSFAQLSGEFSAGVKSLLDQSLFVVSDGEIEVDSQGKPIIDLAEITDQDMAEFEQAGEQLVEASRLAFLQQLEELRGEGSRTFKIAQSLITLDVDLSQEFVMRSLIFEDYLKTILDVQRYSFINKKSLDLFSLKKDKDSLEALAVLEEITRGINSEIDSKSQALKQVVCEDFLRELDSDIDTQEWKNQFFEILDQNLSVWRDAENSLLSKYTEWESDYAEFYQEGQSVWDNAFEQLVIKKYEWENEFSSLIQSGYEFWETENQSIADAFAESRQIFESSFSVVGENSRAQLDSVVNSIKLHSSLAKSTQNAIFYQLRALMGEVERDSLIFVDIDTMLSCLEEDFDYSNPEILALLEKNRDFDNSRWNSIQELWSGGLRISEILASSELNLLDSTRSVNEFGSVSDFSDTIYDKIANLKEFWERQYLTASAICDYLDDDSSSRLTSAQTLEAAREAKEIADLHFSQYKEKLADLDQLSGQIVLKQEYLKGLQLELESSAAEFDEISISYKKVVAELEFLRYGEDLIIEKIQQSEQDYLGSIDAFANNLGGLSYLDKVVGSAFASNRRDLYNFAQILIDGDGQALRSSLSELGDNISALEEFEIATDYQGFCEDLEAIGVVEGEEYYQPLFDAGVSFFSSDDNSRRSGEQRLLEEVAKLYFDKKFEYSTRLQQINYIFSEKINSWVSQYDCFSYDFPPFADQEMIVDQLERSCGRGQLDIVAGVYHRVSHRLKSVSQLDENSVFSLDFSEFLESEEDMEERLGDYVFYLINSSGEFLGESSLESIIAKVERLEEIVQRIGTGEELELVLGEYEDGGDFACLLEGGENIAGFGLVSNLTANYQRLVENRLGMVRSEFFNYNPDKILGEIVQSGKSLGLFKTRLDGTFDSLVPLEELLPQLVAMSLDEAVGFFEGVEKIEQGMLALSGRESLGFSSESFALIKEFVVAARDENLSEYQGDYENTLVFDRFAELQERVISSADSHRLVYHGLESGQRVEEINFGRDYSYSTYYLRSGESIEDRSVVRKNYMLDIAQNLRQISWVLEKNLKDVYTLDLSLLSYNQPVNIDNLDESGELLSGFAAQLDAFSREAKSLACEGDGELFSALQLRDATLLEIKDYGHQLLVYRRDSQGYIDDKFLQATLSRDAAESNYNEALSKFNSELGSEQNQALLAAQSELIQEISELEGVLKGLNEEFYLKQAINDYASGIYFAGGLQDQSVGDPYFLREKALEKVDYYSNLGDLVDSNSVSNNSEYQELLSGYEQQYNRVFSVAEILGRIEQQVGVKQNELLELSQEYSQLRDEFFSGYTNSSAAFTKLDLVVNSSAVLQSYMGENFNFSQEIFANTESVQAEFLQEAEDFLLRFASLEKSSVYNIYRAYSNFCFLLASEGSVEQPLFTALFSQENFDFYKLFGNEYSRDVLEKEMIRQEIDIDSQIMGEFFVGLDKLSTTQRGLLREFILYTSSGLLGELKSSADEYSKRFIRKKFVSVASELYKEREETLKQLKLSNLAVVSIPVVNVIIAVLADKQDKLENLAGIFIEKDFPQRYVFEEFYESDKKNLKSTLYRIMSSERYSDIFGVMAFAESNKFINEYAKSGDASVSYKGISLADIVQNSSQIKPLFDRFATSRRVLVAKGGVFDSFENLAPIVANTNLISTSDLRSFKNIVAAKYKLDEKTQEISSLSEDIITDYNDFESVLFEFMPESYREIYVSEDRDEFKEIVESLLRSGEFSFQDLISEVFVVANNRAFELGEEIFSLYSDSSDVLYSQLAYFFGALERGDDVTGLQELCRLLGFYDTFADSIFSKNSEIFSQFASLNGANTSGLEENLEFLLKKSHNILVEKKYREELFLLEVKIADSNFRKQFEQGKWDEKATLVAQRSEKKWQSSFEKYYSSRKEYNDNLSSRYFDQKIDWELDFAEFYEKKNSWVTEFSRKSQIANSKIALEQLGISAECEISCIDSLPADFGFEFEMPDFYDAEFFDNSLSSLEVQSVAGGLSVRSLYKLDLGSFGKSQQQISAEDESLRGLLADVSSQRMFDQLKSAVVEMEKEIGTADKRVQESLEALVKGSGFVREGNYYVRRGVVNRSVFEGTKTEQQLIGAYENFEIPERLLTIEESELSRYRETPEALRIFIERELERLSSELELILGKGKVELGGEVSWAETRLKTIEQAFSKEKLLESLADEEEYLLNTSLQLADCDNPFDNISKYKVINQKSLVVYKEGGLFGDHVGYAPTFRPDAKWINPSESLIGRDFSTYPLEATIENSLVASVAGNINPAGEGEMGRIMAVFLALNLKQGEGFSDFSKNLWDLGLWDDEGSIFPAPSIRDVVNFAGSAAVSVAGMFVGMPWLGAVVGLATDLGFSVLDSIEATSEQELGNIWIDAAGSVATAAVNVGFGMIGGVGTSTADLFSGMSKEAFKTLASGGISLASTAASNVVGGVANSISLGADGLAFDDRILCDSMFGKSAASSFLSTIASTGVSAGMQGVDLAGFLDIDLTAANFTSSFVGSLAGAAVRSGITQELNVNLLNISDLVKMITAISAKASEKAEASEDDADSDADGGKSEAEVAESNSKATTDGDSVAGGAVAADSTTSGSTTPEPTEKSYLEKVRYLDGKTPIWSNLSLGLLEISLGKEKSHIKIGSGGENFSISKFIDAGKGFKVYNENRKIVKSKMDNVAENAVAMRALYSYNTHYSQDQEGLSLYKNILSGVDKLVDVNNEEQMKAVGADSELKDQKFRAKTEASETGRNIFFDSSLISEDLNSKLGFGVTLQHEAYRDGHKSSLEEQLKETFLAVVNHTHMAKVLDTTYDGFVASDDNIKGDSVYFDESVRTGDWRIMGLNVLFNYDSSGDYWLYDEKTGRIEFDGRHGLYSKNTGKIIQEYLRKGTFKNSDGKNVSAFFEEYNEDGSVKIHRGGSYAESFGVWMGLIPEVGSYSEYSEFKKRSDEYLDENGLDWDPNMQVVVNGKVIRKGAWVREDGGDNIVLGKDSNGNEQRFLVFSDGGNVADDEGNVVNDLNQYTFESGGKNISGDKLLKDSQDFYFKKQSLFDFSASEGVVQGNSFMATTVGLIDGSGVKRESIYSSNWIANYPVRELKGYQNSYAVKNGDGSIKEWITMPMYEKDSNRVDEINVENVTPEAKRLKAMKIIVDKNGVKKYDVNGSERMAFFGLTTTVPDINHWNETSPALKEGLYSYFVGDHNYEYKGLRYGTADGINYKPDMSLTDEERNKLYQFVYQYCKLLGISKDINIARGETSSHDVLSGVYYADMLKANGYAGQDGLLERYLSTTNYINSHRSNRNPDVDPVGTAYTAGSLGCLVIYPGNDAGTFKRYNSYIDNFQDDTLGYMYLSRPFGDTENDY